MRRSGVRAPSAPPAFAVEAVKAARRSAWRRRRTASRRRLPSRACRSPHPARTDTPPADEPDRRRAAIRAAPPPVRALLERAHLRRRWATRCWAWRWPGRCMRSPAARSISGWSRSCSSCPAAAFMLVAGQIADRYDRRRLLQICQTAEGLAAATLALGIRLRMGEQGVHPRGRLRVRRRARVRGADPADLAARRWCRCRCSPARSRRPHPRPSSRPSSDRRSADCSTPSARRSPIRSAARCFSRRSSCSPSCASNAARRRARPSASPPSSPAFPTSGAIRSCSASSRSTCSPCCSAAPRRCCRSSLTRSSMSARKASACCAPRRPSARC